MSVTLSELANVIENEPFKYSGTIKCTVYEYVPEIRFSNINKDDYRQFLIRFLSRIGTSFIYDDNSDTYSITEGNKCILVDFNKRRLLILTDRI